MRKLKFTDVKHWCQITQLVKGIASIWTQIWIQKLCFFPVYYEHQTIFGIHQLFYCMMPQERVGQDILRIAWNVTLDLCKWKQPEGWPAQKMRETVDGLQTSAQETVLTLRLTIPVYTIRDENLSLLFSCYNQRKREALCWFLCVLKGRGQATVKMLPFHGSPFTFH